MIDWKGVVNNAVSVLVAAVFVGAAAIMWNRVTTIDDIVGKHTAKLRVNQDSLINTQSELKASQTALTDNIVDLQGQIELLSKQILSLQRVLKDIKKTKTTKYTIPENKPLILPQYMVDKDYISKLKKAEEKKIQTKIQSLKPSYKSLFTKQFQQQIQQEVRQ